VEGDRWGREAVGAASGECPMMGLGKLTFRVLLLQWKLSAVKLGRKEFK
jgi:hypothetical protein